MFGPIGCSQQHAWCLHESKGLLQWLFTSLPGVQRSTRVSLECLHVILARPKHPAFQKGLGTWVAPPECCDSPGIHGQLGIWFSAKFSCRWLTAQHVHGCCTKFQVPRHQDREDKRRQWRNHQSPITMTPTNNQESELSPTVAIKSQN